MKNYIQNELACLRALEPVGSDRYNELSKAIQWVEEHADKEQKTNTESNGKYAPRQSAGQKISVKKRLLLQSVALSLKRLMRTFCSTARAWMSLSI